MKLVHIAFLSCLQTGTIVQQEDNLSLLIMT